MADTHRLDQILAEKRSQQEQERQFLLEKTRQWLNHNGTEYGIKTAYIFGSVTRPYRFRPQSDIDVAVEQINPDLFFQMISELYTKMGREVDVIELHKCHFSHKIREQGILWTKTPSSC